MTLARGTKLGPYEILAPIGAGGMGEVWKARDTRLGRIVAIKKIKEQHSERFKQEARSIAALNHPYICQIHDIGPDYIVLEYVEGKPLSSPLPEREAVRLAIQIAAALEAAHKKGIIHRDLKPGNIMVTDEGSVKLLDFGLAKLYEQSAGESTAELPATQAGAVLGTVAYMSPEQAQGQPADARSDIFSFGLVLYEMLSGKRAFVGDSNPAILAALLRDEPGPLQVSPPVERVIRRCLAKQASGRYQSVSEVKSALEQVFAEKAPVSTSEQQPSIAVLPFVNMSGDKEQEYFSDGLAEEIINALTHIRGLRVIARTSAFAFKGKQEDIRKIAEILGVANILEGSVRKAGNRIRVTAQLITAADGSHLWSDRYDRDLTDIFAIQDEIAAAIASVLQVKLSMPSATRRGHEPSLASHEAYLKARHLFGMLKPGPVAQAKQYLEEAITLDPDYALAHCGLADHYLAITSSGLVPAHETMPIVRDETQRALAVDPSLAEAHAISAIVAGVFDYDWGEAARRFQLALARDLVPARIRQWYGWFYLLPQGRKEEAITQLEQGCREDPLNVIARSSLAYSLFIAGRLDEALVEEQKILEFEANYAWASYTAALTYIYKGKWVEALNVAEKGYPLIPQLIGVLAGIFQHLGNQARVEEYLHKLMPGSSYGAPFGLVVYSVVCGEMDKASDWMEKAIEQRHPLAYALLPLIRSSRRFPALARLMNLPEKAI